MRLGLLATARHLDHLRRLFGLADRVPGSAGPAPVVLVPIDEEGAVRDHPGGHLGGPPARASRPVPGAIQEHRRPRGGRSLQGNAHRDPGRRHRHLQGHTPSASVSRRFRRSGCAFRPIPGHAQPLPGGRDEPRRPGPDRLPRLRRRHAGRVPAGRVRLSTPAAARCVEPSPARRFQVPAPRGPRRKHLHELSYLRATAQAGAGFIVVRLVLGLFGMDYYEIYWWFAAGLVFVLSGLVVTTMKFSRSCVAAVQERDESALKRG